MSTRQISSRSGHVEDSPGAVQDVLADGQKAVTHTTHFFLSLWFPFFCTPLPPLSLRYFYSHFYLPLLFCPSLLLLQLSPSSLHPSSFPPVVPSFLWTSPCSISHICPNSLCFLRGLLPEGSLNCFFISTAGFCLRCRSSSAINWQ